MESSLRGDVLSSKWMAEFIEATDLRKTYRVGRVEVPALRGISFSVKRGEFVSVVGPSGSGKSTLFYLLGGLTRPDTGRVAVDGDDFAQLSDAERTRMRKRKIGFVFQKFNLLPTLDARSNIGIAQDIAGKKADPAHFDKITEMLGLSKRLAHRPSELSGASNSGWRWRGRSSIVQRWCWPTSPRGIWTQRTQPWCSTCCGMPIVNWGKRC